MKSGKAYLESPERRLFDVAAGAELLQLRAAVRLAATATFGCTTTSHERIGRGGALTTITKLRTTDENGDSLHPLASFIAKTGLDELWQLDLVLNGTMSIVGSRHLNPNDYDKLRDLASHSLRGRTLLARHDESVLPAKRGIFSTFAVASHAGLSGSFDNEAAVIRRLQLDVIDYTEASPERDLDILIFGTGSLALHELKRRTAQH